MVALILLLACARAPEEEPPELRFLRDAVLHPDGRVVPYDWTPGETVAVDGASGVAPRRAECTALYSVDLGDVRRLVASGGAAPDTALAFADDGRLAVGSHRGEILLLDADGKVTARRRLAETMVKRLAWSEDGRTLYAAEQSPDALVHALEPDTLATRWSYRLADDVGHSPLPADDLYGVYTLPGAYGLDVLPGGDLLVTAVHGWNDAEGRRLNRSRLLRLTPDGAVRAAWPTDGALDATIRRAVVDPEGGLVAVPVFRSADGPAPEGLPIGGVQLLDLETLTPGFAWRGEPLRPWYQRVAIWEAVDVDRSDDALLVGLNDGRVRLLDLEGEERFLREAGTPVLAGEVPIAASVGFATLREGEAVWITSDTSIPWGSAAPELRPPTRHPNANRVWVAGLDGEVRWSWSGEHRLEGMALRDEVLVVGATERQTDARRDLYGALVFDLGGEAGSGEERLRAFCPTEGPVFFHQAVSADGRIAVAEHPVQEADGSFTGGYRVTVLR